MLSVSIAFLTYEGLTRNVRVTYAKRMPGVLGASTKFIDFMASHISGRFTRDLSNKPSVCLIIITICAHPCLNLYLNIQSTIMNGPCSDSIIIFSWLGMIQKTYCKPNEQLFPMSYRDIATYVIKTQRRWKQYKKDTKTINTVNQIRSTALERSVIKYLGFTQSDGILTSFFTSEVVQNNYMEGSESVTIK